MQRKITTWLVPILASAALLGTTTGCKEWLVGSHLTAFGAGWLARDLTMPMTTETLCYRNGELIDCAEALPNQPGE